MDDLCYLHDEQQLGEEDANEDSPRSYMYVAAGGCALLVPVFLAVYLSKPSSNEDANKQAAKIKAQQELQDLQSTMQQWYAMYDEAQAARDALSAKVQDPNEALAAVFNNEALQDPNAPPAPNNMQLIQSQHASAVNRVQELHAYGQNLKAQYDTLLAAAQ